MRSLLVSGWHFGLTWPELRAGLGSAFQSAKRETVQTTVPSLCGLYVVVLACSCRQHVNSKAQATQGGIP